MNRNESILNIEKSNLIRSVQFPAIDGIRIYAAAIVFFQHVLGGIVIEYYKIDILRFNYRSDNGWLRAVNYLSDGNHGVDVFFILSGFLMSRILVRKSSSFSYVGFIWSRLKRIYPAFFVSLVVCTACVTTIFGWDWDGSRFVKNMFFLNAFPVFGVLPYNHVSWSLGYEFAFYFLIPVIIFLARFFDVRICAGILLLSAYFLIPDNYFRFLALFIGAFIGSFSDRFLSAVAEKVPLILPFVIYILLGLARAVYDLKFSSTYCVFIFTSSILFICIVWNEGCWLNRFLSKKVFRALGSLSYSIYLYHSIVASLVLHKVTPWPASAFGVVWAVIISIALTLLVSYFSYVLFEKWYFSDDRRVKKIAPNQRVL
ncbi:acyltransferase family protein [Schauerella aestuarii]|uniref:acyltransferase family protein n=1 Tax=Schauerella aestuarii TaxID=2511204 RepID=UPI0013680C37|nr:acyltransferase [Achromobacter aestuarii]MYZ43656.1 acyltransferase [Achromobacter aestuarii]